MERRTFLKGILGAAAAAFHPSILEKAAMASADTAQKKEPVPIITCVRDGYYLISSVTEVVHRNDSACYSIRILRNRQMTGIGVCSMIGEAAGVFQSGFSVMMFCKAGDQFSLELLENGVDRTEDLKSALFEIEEATPPKDGYFQPIFMFSMLSPKDEGGPIPIHIE